MPSKQRLYHDLLLIPRDLPQAVATIEKAVRDGVISQKELDADVLKILQAKERLQLHKNRIVSEKNLSKKVSTSAARELKKKLYRAAITLVGESDLLPLPDE